ncbi:MAG: gamma-glutamyltransferase [Kofleriaceae bacterium]
MHAHRAVVLVLSLVAASSAACRRQVGAPAPTAASRDAGAGSAAVATGPDDGGLAPTAAGTEVAVGTRGAVTSAEARATAVGLEVLRAGGNAVDAAVAVGLALGVTHPSAGNLGGGGFMVVRSPDGTATSFDFREVAPAAARADMYIGADGAVTEDSKLGPRAAGIPGDAAGFALAHARLGSRPWAELVAPAITLARDGVVLDRFHADDLGWGAERAEAYLAALTADAGARPALREAVAASVALWRRPDGTPWAAGDTWRQPELARTLEALAAGGADGFYRGPVGLALADGVAAMGGLWTAADLAGYRALERPPLIFDYHGHRVITMPPPSAGGVTLRQIFAASDVLGLATMPWDAVDRLHLYVEALRRVFADRSFAIADPAFVDLPMATLTDAGYVRDRLADVDPAHATPSSSIAAGVEVVEKPQTTHFSVVDGAGLAVAVTYTLNGGFGAKVVVPGTGVILNNEMDDFTAKVGAPNMFGLVQGPQNAIAPGKRMVSSMTPTIVEQDGALRVVCGSPGGPTIITTVAQILLQVIDHGTPLDAAIAAPRVHHQWLPDQVMHEASLDPALAAGLTARGHALRDRGRIGHANCIERTPTGQLRAVADTGRDGGAAAAL